MRLLGPDLATGHRCDYVATSFSRESLRISSARTSLLLSQRISWHRTGFRSRAVYRRPCTFRKAETRARGRSPASRPVPEEGGERREEERRGREGVTLSSEGCQDDVREVTASRGPEKVLTPTNVLSALINSNRIMAHIAPHLSRLKLSARGDHVVCWFLFHLRSCYSVC